VTIGSAAGKPLADYPRRHAATPIALLSVFALTAAASAETVRITVSGSVDSLSGGIGLFANVNPGDAAEMSFTIDTNAYTDGSNPLTRGYPIDVASFSMHVGPVAVDLAHIKSATPYFVIFDHPSADMFNISTDPDVVLFPSLQQDGQSGPLTVSYHQSYGGGTLQSVDVLDALGAYDATNQMTSNWGVDDHLLRVAALQTESLVIEVEPQYCPADIAGPEGAPDGVVDAIDLLRLVAQWGGGCTGLCTADISGPAGGADGVVDAMDYAAMIAQWGAPGACLSGVD
jgi:hypothetical protein